MHSSSSIIFRLSLSLQSTSNPSIVAQSHLLGLGPCHSHPWLQVTSCVSKQLLSHPWCWTSESFFCTDPLLLLGGTAACMWETERDEKRMANFCFQCIFFIQAVFGVDCICRHHNCLECFYQRLPGKNGLLLSPPQCFQVSQQSASFIFSKTNQEMEF